jgi:hypothetical protein
MLPPSRSLSLLLLTRYNKAQQGMPVTIRMSRPKFHSSATFVCPISPLSTAPAAAVNVEAGPKQPITVGLLHHKMKKVRRNYSV